MAQHSGDSIPTGAEIIEFPDYQEYECKVLDGTTIRGWLFLVDRTPAPTIIMTPGVSFPNLKEPEH